MPAQFRVDTPAGGSVTAYPVAGGGFESTCDSCGGGFTKGDREAVEEAAKEHLAARVNCAYPMHR